MYEITLEEWIAGESELSSNETRKSTGISLTEGIL